MIAGRNTYRAKRALLIVDWLRRDKILCKAYISPREVSREFDEDKWWLESGLTEVKSKYRSWWNMNLDWQEKKQVDPLAQTNIRIKENCG